MRLIIKSYHVLIKNITPCQLVSSAGNLCKQFGSRSGPTKCRARSGSKLFGTLKVFLKEFFEIFDFEKNQQTTKKHEKLPSRQRVCVHVGLVRAKIIIATCLLEKNYYSEKI